MAIDWDAELLGPVMAVFGEGDLAAPASWPTYTPYRGTAFQLPHAVFDRSYQEVTPHEDGSQTTTFRPVLGVRAALFPTPPAQNDRVYIPSAGMTYIVRDARPDGHGHVLLMLMEAA